MLDESLDILTAAWSGEPVRFRGEHYTVDGMRFLPRPVQRPGVPVWVAGYYGKSRPLSRAARYQGASCVPPQAAARCGHQSSRYPLGVLRFLRLVPRTYQQRCQPLRVHDESLVQAAACGGPRPAIGGIEGRLCHSPAVSRGAS